MTKLTFLGTGGGRFATVYQVRRTGGLYLEDGARVHVDPGPGAALALRELGMDPARTDAVLVSHCHPDHYTDAEVLAEGMTACSFSRRGVLAGSRSAIQGTAGFGPAVSAYHRRIVPHVQALSPGDSLVVKRLRVQATRTLHSDPDGVGFRFHTSDGDISYVGDSELRPEVLGEHAGARVLIMNVTRPLRSRVRYHMSTEDAGEMAAQVRPELAILAHFGSKLVHDGVERQRRWVEERSGVRTVAAEDFMRLHLGKRALVRMARPGAGTARGPGGDGH